MRPVLRSLLAAAALAVIPCLLAAQDSDDTDHEPGHWSLDLPVRGYGISFGNAARFNGLRFNLSDAGLDRINGVNITLWKPGKPVTGTVNGLALGIVGPAADGPQRRRDRRESASSPRGARAGSRWEASVSSPKAPSTAWRSRASAWSRRGRCMASPWPAWARCPRVE